MNNTINKLKQLKGIEYSSKERLLQAIGEQLKDINIKDYAVNYNFIVLELGGNNKINIIFNTNNYKIDRLEITTINEIIF